MKDNVNIRQCTTVGRDKEKALGSWYKENSGRFLGVVNYVDYS
jgi:hypothetical protein